MSAEKHIIPVDLPVLDVSQWSGVHEVILETAGQEISIVGGYDVRNNDAIMLDLRVIHKAPHTKANIVLKGVLREKAKLNLSGTLVIEKNAQGSQSFLRENILLLSSHAVAEAIPNLEIHTDDVKCSHAATMTAIPQEHLFYLQSRGLSNAVAQDLMIESFLKEVLAPRKII